MNILDSFLISWCFFHHILGLKYLTAYSNMYREGNGNLLPYSCLENPRDRGVQWAAIHGVAQSRAWLKRLISSSNMYPHNWCFIHVLLICFLYPPVSHSSLLNFKAKVSDRFFSELMLVIENNATSIFITLFYNGCLGFFSLRLNPWSISWNQDLFWSDESKTLGLQ